ncbi:MAG: OmpA family protein [Bacteroidota bacterium]
MLKEYFNKKAFGALIFFGLISTSVFSQSDSVALSQEYMAQADQIYSQQKEAIEIAKELYAKAADLDPNNLKANWRAGQLYLETINKDQATKYFLRIYDQDPSYRFDMLYQIGRGYHYGLDFDTALEYYEKYRKKFLAHPRYRGKDKTRLKTVERRIHECKSGKDIISKPTQYSIVPLGEEINSPWPDYAPVLNEKGDVMIFTSRRQDGNTSENVDEDNFYFEDIFISRKVNGKWTQAKNIGAPINSAFHEASISLSEDGNRLYIYRDDNAGDIYYSEYNGSEWSKPKYLTDKINSSYYAENSVSETSSSDIIFYSSNRPGGRGGVDIYMCIKDNKGRWYKSKSLGPVINTKFDEESPHLATDGKTLYFSSSGHKGYGGYDIFRSVYDSASGEWSEPENLGYPVNTPDDEIYFHVSPDGRTGYFASVREGGIGFTDIFEVKYHGGRQGAGDRIVVVNNQIKELVSQKESASAVENSQKVKFEEHELNLIASAHKIYFNARQSAIDSKHEQELDSVINLINKYEILSIDVAGFASADGNPRFNLELSQKRALIVLNYLVSKGVDESRIVAKGYGAIEHSEGSGEENRRAEVRIVGAEGSQ